MDAWVVEGKAAAMLPHSMYACIPKVKIAHQVSNVQGKTGFWSLWGGRGAERCESGGGVEAGGKAADEGDHGGMPKAVEAEEIHFFQGLLGGPFFDGHPISGDEDAGAVIAVAAMHENLLSGVIAEIGKELQNLLVGGRGPSADGDVYEAHAQGFRLATLPEDFFAVFAAEIDDGGDAEFFKFGEALGPRLRAAVEMIVNFSAIGNGGDVKFFSVSRMHFRSCRGLRMFLRGKGAKQERNGDEREKQSAPHHRCDASSVARGEKREKRCKESG